MSQHRSIFLHGLSLTLRRLPAFLWTYLFNLTLALFFSIHLYRQLSALLTHSLAAQRLTGGFDLATVAESIFRLTDAPAGGAATATTAVPLYLLLYFLLVPGTLFCYLTNTPARLSTLLYQGLHHFWRFTRITLLTLIVSTLILGPLFFLQSKFADSIDNHLVGRTSFLLQLASLILVLLVASILRLYFDLVEVYTVQLGLSLRSPFFGTQATPDRRVRRALGPAWRTLTEHFAQAWPVFLFLSILGAAAVFLTARTAMHMLAQPRVWPMFLLAQLGLFLMLFTRFWQRGAETSLALQRPILTTSMPPILPIAGIVNHADPQHPTPHPTPAPIPDPIPDPEPASPSLDEPDPGVFHHTPTRPPD